MQSASSNASYERVQVQQQLHLYVHFYHSINKLVQKHDFSRRESNAPPANTLLSMVRSTHARHNTRCNVQGGTWDQSTCRWCSSVACCWFGFDQFLSANVGWQFEVNRGKKGPFSLRCEVFSFYMWFSQYAWLFLNLKCSNILFGDMKLCCCNVGKTKANPTPLFKRQKTLLQSQAKLYDNIIT